MEREKFLRRNNEQTKYFSLKKSSHGERGVHGEIQGEKSIVFRQSHRNQDSALTKPQSPAML